MTSQPDRGGITPILPHLFLGASGDAQNLLEMQAVGITHVLNMTAEVPNFFEGSPGLVYTRISVCFTIGRAPLHMLLLQPAPTALTRSRIVWAPFGAGGRPFRGLPFAMRARIALRRRKADQCRL